ncbi:MAG: nitroreductase family protein [Pyrinomonadaceae bacterium]
MTNQPEGGTITVHDKPTNLPETQADGAPLKPITQVLLERRATNHFLPEEVPEEYLNAILRLAAQAPSGYNLQPWRFIVVRGEENRKRLQAVAFGQPKVAEAPVVVIAVGMKEEWKARADEVFREGAERGAGSIDAWEKYRDGALQFLNGMQHMPTWVNRHTMIAFTTMMLAAEAYGFDTAPMEGFDAAGVKREFGIPEEGEVVALLAIGRAAGAEKAYPGRFELPRIVYAERYGEAWGEE